MTDASKTALFICQWFLSDLGNDRRQAAESRALLVKELKKESQSPCCREAKSSVKLEIQGIRGIESKDHLHRLRYTRDELLMLKSSVLREDKLKFDISHVEAIMRSKK